MGTKLAEIEAEMPQAFRTGAAADQRVSHSIVSLFFLLFFALIALAWAMPSGNFVLVLTNPAAKPDTGIEVIGAAGGSFVASGRYPWMSIAYSEDGGFPARLMQSGALLVLNHQLAVGCLVREVE